MEFRMLGSLKWWESIIKTSLLHRHQQGVMEGKRIGQPFTFQSVSPIPGQGTDDGHGPLSPKQNSNYFLPASSVFSNSYQYFKLYFSTLCL